MKQKLLKYKQCNYESNWKPVEYIKEVIEYSSIDMGVLDIRDDYRREDGYIMSGWFNDTVNGGYGFRVYKIHEIEPTLENKMRIRQDWNIRNPIYAMCVVCGRDLHEHNKNTHFESQYGMIGPECFKKVASVL